jgi:hypothetical protein
MRRLQRRPSPALVVAVVALLVGLCGTGVAAVSVALPPGSVGTAQLKKGAVVSSKVRDRSLRSVDFATGQLPKGATGPAGPPGPSNAYMYRGNTGAKSVGISNLSETTIGTVDIPEAGSYVITSKAVVHVSAPATAKVMEVICNLYAAGDQQPAFDTSFVVETAAVPWIGVVVNSVDGVYTAAGTARLTCIGSGAGVVASANWVEITALRVGDLKVTRKDLG